MNPPAKLPISVCIISGNEAHRIGNTLKSVAGWAGEIVVVINEDVSDGTDKVVEAFGGKVFRETWKGFGRQKQSVVDKCAQPWVLNLDADEVVSPELQQEIRRLVAGGETRAAGHAAYSFPRCSFYCGRWIRHGDWYPDRQTRLWRRGQARWSTDIVHEKLEVDGAVGRLRGDLLHFSNESIDRHLLKIIPFSDRFVQQRKGRRVGAFGLLLRPAWRFFRAYFLRLGFLDGWQGGYIAYLNAFSAATRYAKLHEAETGKMTENQPTS
jgi:glycosyltransferase involved in cell wall biosynthesis